MTNLKQRIGFGTELTYDSSGGDGTFQAFSAALSFPAAIIIFDNQSDQDVSISVDGTNTWRTFEAGDALVLDCTTNKTDQANDLKVSEGTLFYASSAAGTGNFTISYNYPS